VDDEIQIPPAGDIAVRRIVARLPVLAGGEGELQAILLGGRSLEVACGAGLATIRELVRVASPRLQPLYHMVHRVAELFLRNGSIRDRHGLAGIGFLNLQAQLQVPLPAQRVALHLHELIQPRRPRQ
jgi:hypothetical protein